MRAAIEVTLSKPARTSQQLEAMATVNRSVARAERTVEALLTLAPTQAGPGTRETVDLATAAEDALDAAQTAIGQRRLDVDSELEPALTSGDRVLLERMVANLVDNAVQHNLVDGWIGGRTVQRDDGAVFEIANTGPGVTPEQIRPCSSRSHGLPSSNWTPPTGSGSDCRSPAQSRPCTTRPSPPAHARAEGYMCQSRSPLARTDRAEPSRPRSRSQHARAAREAPRNTGDHDRVQPSDHLSFGAHGAVSLTLAPLDTERQSADVTAPSVIEQRQFDRATSRHPCSRSSTSSAASSVLPATRAERRTRRRSPCPSGRLCPIRATEPGCGFVADAQR